LVLAPIERMISKIDKIRNNPLAAMSIGDEEHRREEAAEMRKSGAVQGRPAQSLNSDSSIGTNAISRTVSRFHDAAARFKARFKPKAAKQAPEPMETVVLEKTIIKIGSLLALGFGEAGASIIGQNMKGGDTAALNAMIPGRRVEAIFGFCNIRNFTDATEVLQDQVMVFVNSIAAVVHSCAHEYFGSPNKNTGDAFLLCWSLSAYKQSKQQRLADMALICLVKIVAEVNKSELLAAYRTHSKLVRRLPNYRVRLGFGMHEGWAIEGAIGSEFKIDASYLSPNVNIAQRLEGVTSKYGVMILISDSIHKLMSIQIAEECRHHRPREAVGRQRGRGALDTRPRRFGHGGRAPAQNFATVQ
jgi:class 3 adenylate cyclase